MKGPSCQVQVDDMYKTGQAKVEKWEENQKRDVVIKDKGKNGGWKKKDFSEA